MIRFESGATTITVFEKRAVCSRRVLTAYGRLLMSQELCRIFFGRALFGVKKRSRERVTMAHVRLCFYYYMATPERVECLESPWKEGLSK